MMQAALTTSFEKLQAQLDFTLPFQTSLDTDENITANQYVDKVWSYMSGL